jgi:hypothetical protein
MIPVVKAKLLEGKKGLIVGIANENSIAWGCAKAFRAFGAELAGTYLNDKAKKYVEPLAPGVRTSSGIRIAESIWHGELDFVVDSHLAAVKGHGEQGPALLHQRLGEMRDAGERGPLHGGRTRSQGHPRPCDLTWTARDLSGVRDPRIRRTVGEGEDQSPRTQSGKHRRRWSCHGVSGARRRKAHDRRYGVHRRRISHHRLGNRSNHRPPAGAVRRR